MGILLSPIIESLGQHLSLNHGAVKYEVSKIRFFPGNRRSLVIVEPIGAHMKKSID